MSNFTWWQYSLSFTYSYHFQWPWFYFKVTTVSDSFNWKFCVLIQLCWNFVNWWLHQVDHEYTLIFYFCTCSRVGWLVCVVLLAQSTLKDYIRAKNKLQPVSYLFFPQVIIAQVFLSKPISNSSAVSEHKPRKTHVLEPIYNPWALNTGTCISCLQQWAGCQP